MKVENNRKIGVSYKLTVNGKLEDQADSSNPLIFVFGKGQLLPAFEAALEGLEPGQTFTATLPPEEGYGHYNEKNKIELPLHIFEIDGQIDHELLRVGNTIPMQTQHGTTMVGRVAELLDQKVLMDFNHPLAGQTLQFEGCVESVEMLSQEELDHLDHPHSCDCCGNNGCCDSDSHGHAGSCDCGC